MSTSATRPLLSVEDYIDGELNSDIRHEYIDGQVYAMAGASERHGRIAGNTFFHLRSAARGGSCGVFQSDMKVRIEAGNRFYYPDVLMYCDPADNEDYFKRRPCLIAEVLSESTEATDRREKWLAYRLLPSLQYYLLIASKERFVEYCRRSASGDWDLLLLSADERLEIHCEGLRASLSLDDIYEDVRW